MYYILVLCIILQYFKTKLFMFKKFRFFFFIVIIGVAPFLMAGGDSGGGGGSGGGGKGNGKNGGASTDTGAWRKAFLNPDWTYAYTPVPTNCGCPNSGGASGQGQCYPMARSSNSYPNINNQNSISSSEYYSRITVTNLGIVPGWAHHQKLLQENQDVQRFKYLIISLIQLNLNI
jgi:hypothetical protein